jgi:hypothetical protein
MPFDFEALAENPMFNMGIGLMGAYNQQNGGQLLQAQQAMQQAVAVKQKRKDAEEARAIQRDQLTRQEARDAAVEARAQREQDWKEKFQPLQLDQHSAQTAVARMNAEALQKQNERQAAVQARNAAVLSTIAKDPRFAKFAPILQGLAGEGAAPPPEQGGQPPALPAMPQAAPAMPSAGPALPAPTPTISTGKYGTPTAILDGLAKTESSNNPIALGPIIGRDKGGKPVRAQGMFQFLPDTVNMLRSQGMNFDPFKPQEARDAADFYLQQLHKQNGGDWNKTLAAYGGFKKADPSQYIAKVMGGSPEQQARQMAQQQNAQGATNPFADSQDLQQLAGILTMADMPNAGKGLELMGKAAAPVEMKPGAVYQGSDGTQYEQPDPKGDVKRGYEAEDQAIKRSEAIQKQDKANWEKTQRPAAEAHQAATTANIQADVKTKTTKLDNAVEQKAAGQGRVNTVLGDLRKSYDALAKNNGITDPANGIFSNLPARVESSATGQFIGKAVGTANQSERNKIAMARPLLLQSIMQATGMSAKQMDSNVELQMYLKAATDPTLDIKANRAALDRLQEMFGGNKAAQPGAAAPTSQPDRKSQFKVLR